MEGMSNQVMIRSRSRDRTILSRSPMCGRASTYKGDPLEGMAVGSEMKLSYRKAWTAGLQYSCQGP